MNIWRKIEIRWNGDFHGMYLGNGVFHKMYLGNWDFHGMYHLWILIHLPLKKKNNTNISWTILDHINNKYKVKTSW